MVELRYGSLSWNNQSNGKPRIFGRISLCAALFVLGVISPRQTKAELIYGLGTDGNLFTFDSSTLGPASFLGPITGIGSDTMAGHRTTLWAWLQDHRGKPPSAIVYH